MFCENCGKQIEDDSTLCPYCGNDTSSNSMSQQNTNTNKNSKNFDTTNKNSNKAVKYLKKLGVITMSDSEESQYDVSNNQKKLQNTFIEPDEQLLGKFGNGYFVNLLFNNTKKCHALLTDKRIYLKGTFYSGGGKNILKTTEERTLDLEDVTGTGFIYQKVSLIMLFLSLLFGIIEIIGIPALIIDGEQEIVAVLVLCLPFTILLIMLTLKSRRIFFFIDYAGGRIKIDARLIGLSDVRDFHKQMRRAKDALKKEK